MIITECILLPEASLNGTLATTLVLLYTDPGTGALIWQLLAAAVFGGMFYFRSFFARVKESLAARKSEREKLVE